MNISKPYETAASTTGYEKHILTTTGEEEAAQQREVPYTTSDDPVADAEARLKSSKASIENLKAWLAKTEKAYAEDEARLEAVKVKKALMDRIRHDISLGAATCRLLEIIRERTREDRSRGEILPEIIVKHAFELLPLAESYDHSIAKQSGIYVLYKKGEE